MRKKAEKFEVTLNEMIDAAMVNDIRHIEDMDEETFRTIKAAKKFIDATNDFVKKQADMIENIDEKLDELNRKLDLLLKQ